MFFAGSTSQRDSVETIKAKRNPTGMRTVTRFYRAGILSLTLIAPFAMAPSALPADDHRPVSRRYRDAKHNDEHEWNNREDQAYRMWVQERRRKYQDFDRIRERDRDNYWNWRHEHSDAQLRIQVR